MQKLLTGIATAALLGVASGASAGPAQSGADKGAYCDWVNPDAVNGPPGNGWSLAAKTGVAGIVHQFQAKGVPLITPAGAVISDDQIGAGGDQKRILAGTCNLPVPVT